jgi:hypothetical protein
MIAGLWEWAVLKDARSHPVGVCMTEHAAMRALSKALVAAGRPAQGQVTPMTLVRPVQSDPVYEREPVERTAVYDGVVIQWC